jgi:hypothetical protein
MRRRWREIDRLLLLRWMLLLLLCPHVLLLLLRDLNREWRRRPDMHGGRRRCGRRDLLLHVHSHRSRRRGVRRRLRRLGRLSLLLLRVEWEREIGVLPVHHVRGQVHLLLMVERRNERPWGRRRHSRHRRVRRRMLLLLLHVRVRRRKEMERGLNSLLLLHVV